MSERDPRGFRTVVASVGIKDSTPDFSVIVADHPCSAAAVFTRSRFQGPSVKLSRRNAADGRLQAIVTVSKNANVATGPAGAKDAAEVVSLVASLVGADVQDMLIGSTGVIGRPYPMDRLRAGIAGLAIGDGADFQAVAEAMMTTDTRPKLARARIGGRGGGASDGSDGDGSDGSGGDGGDGGDGGARIVGLAKGVGMIEPDMATLLTYFMTDAAVAPEDLDAIFRRVVDQSFNCLSIDTDTSTSDTAAVLASGDAGPVDLPEFERALLSVARDLTRQVAADGEGATTLIEVIVDEARDEAQARRVAKSIVNSPLVKTAVHGGDPNWGRVAMAIGKCYDRAANSTGADGTDGTDEADEADGTDGTGIDPEHTVIRFGDLEVYPRADPDLARLSEVMAADEVLIHVSLGTGAAQGRVWGCDLSAGYVRINADYTT